jgi:hypothetical protein
VVQRPPLATGQVEALSGSMFLRARPASAGLAVAAAAAGFLAGCMGVGGSENNAAERRSATAFPQGTFVTTITHEDLVRAGLNHPPIFPGIFPGTTTLTLKSGTFAIVLSRHPRQLDAGGQLIVHGNQVRFGSPGGDLLKWSYFRGLLTFRIASVPDAAARLMWTAHPWQRVR